VSYANIVVEPGPDDTVTITLNRPDNRNALSSSMIAELHEALETTAASQARGIILAANGPVFSSGHDLREMAGHDEAGMLALFERCEAMMLTLGRIPKVVVASVAGLATAAGCQLVASCDLVVASAEASFQTPGGRGGLFCHTPMVAVARNIGRKRAAEMAFTGEPIDARTAAEWGLVNRVVEQDNLAKETHELLLQATRGSRFGTGVGKQTLYEQLDLALAEAYRHTTPIMAHHAVTGDGWEGVHSFVEKRRPDWSHNG
jgi:enoyl-CoA hydratase/carnithine racemase